MNISSSALPVNVFLHWVTSVCGCVCSLISRVSVEVNDEFSWECLPLVSASSSEPFKNPRVLAHIFLRSGHELLATLHNS